MRQGNSECGGVDAKQGADAPTFAELATDVLIQANQAGFADNTLRSYRTALRHHLLPRFGERAVAALGPDDLAELVIDLRERGLTENGILDVIKPLRKTLDLAQRRGLIDSDPYRAVDSALRPRPPRDEHRILSTEEIGVLAVAADEATGVAIGLALFCGLRSSEARELRAGDLEPDRPGVVVRSRAAARGGSGSAGRGAPSGHRRVDGLGDAFGFLEVLCARVSALGLGPDEHLVRSPRGKYFDRGNFSRRYGIVLARAGLAHDDSPPLTFEQLRNNFAALGARIGTNPIELLRQLGKAHTASLQGIVPYFDHPPLSADERGQLEAAAKRLADAPPAQ